MSEEVNITVRHCDGNDVGLVVVETANDQIANQADQFYALALWLADNPSVSVISVAQAHATDDYDTYLQVFVDFEGGPG